MTWTYKRIDDDCCIRNDTLELRRSDLPEWAAYEGWLAVGNVPDQATAADLKTGTMPIIRGELLRRDE